MYQLIRIPHGIFGDVLDARWESIVHLFQPGDAPKKGWDR